MSADRAVLWSGTADALREERTGGFPPTAPQEPSDPQREERVGDTPSTFSDEETRNFLRTVDEKLRTVLAEDPRPLYQQRFAAEIDGKLDEARGRRAFAGGLDEVWAAVREGRAGLVAVEEHLQQTVRVTDEHLEPVSGEAADLTDGTVREDIVDELVEAALDSGADVVLLPDESLAEHGRSRLPCATERTGATPYPSPGPARLRHAGPGRRWETGEGPAGPRGRSRREG